MSDSGGFAQAQRVRRFALPLATALLVLPMLPAATASAATGDVRITAVIRDAHGHLSFRHGRAADTVGARQLAGRWRTDTGVVAAEVDHRIRVAGSPDPLRSQQWGLDTLRAAEVGDATGQTVAIVDTGIDASHPDLAGVVLPGTDIVAGSGDGRTDPNGHGTHVAGIVAAVGDNGIGGAGLAQGAKLLPVRVMAADGTGWDSDAADGLVWAADHGATVVNLSFGGPDRSTVMDAAVRYALGKGVSVVVSGGNEGDNGDPVLWPAADPGVIAVGAVDQSGVRPAWSSTGPHLAVVAPGVHITSTVPTAVDPSGYATWSGTSMAAPFVSASVALLRRARPTLTVSALRQRVIDTADDLGPAGFDPAYGAGRVDAVAAETLAVTVVPTPEPPAPVMTARISASRTTTTYAGAVTLSGRVLADGVGLPGVAVRLERLVGTTWVLTRSGTSGDGGLASWLLHPDRTASYRFLGDGWSSPLVRVVVTPVLSLRATTGGATGRVLPTAATPVRIDYRRGTSWVPVATVTSSADGTFRLTRRLAPGTVVRAVAYGVASPAVRV
jgi:subtilisin family serine protease